MVIAAVYLATLLMCSLYACLRGGKPERYVAAAMLIAYAASLATVRLNWTWNDLFVGVLLIDFGLLLGLIFVAVRANRVWPIAASACQLIQTTGHLVKTANLDIAYFAYWTSQLWSFPILFLMALGTWHHRKRCRSGADVPWKTSF